MFQTAARQGIRSPSDVKSLGHQPLPAPSIAPLLLDVWCKLTVRRHRAHDVLRASRVDGRHKGTWGHWWGRGPGPAGRKMPKWVGYGWYKGGSEVGNMVK